MYGKINLGIITDITDWFGLLYIFLKLRASNIQMHVYMHIHSQQSEVKSLKSLHLVFSYFSVYYNGDVVKW